MKILEKTFITKKCTQCKIVLKYETFFLGYANSSSDPSLILVRQYPIPRASLSPFTISVKLRTGQLKALFNTVLIMLFIGFPILSYLIWPHARSIGYIKPYAKPSHSNLLSSYIYMIKTYGPNTLPIKKVFKSQFSFKVRQHGEQQLNLHEKVC